MAATKPASTSSSAKPKKAKVKGNGHHESERWDLRLYVAGTTPKSVAAISNLRKFCEEYLAGRYTIEIVDLLENPKLARRDQIVAIPTVVRTLPSPMRKIIGDLSDRERVLVAVDLQPR